MLVMPTIHGIKNCDTMNKALAWLYKHHLLRGSSARRAHRRAVIEEVQASAAGKATPGPCAARSQDFLYDDETGLPK
jgi:hypothetical protein